MSKFTKRLAKGMLLTAGIFTTLASAAQADSRADSIIRSSAGSYKSSDSGYRSDYGYKTGDRGYKSDSGYRSDYGYKTGDRGYKSDYSYKTGDYGYRSGHYGSPRKHGSYGSYGSYGHYGSYGSSYSDYLRYDNTGRYVGYHGASPDHYPVPSYSGIYKFGEVWYDTTGRYIGYDRDVYAAAPYGYRSPEAYGEGRWSEAERGQFKLGRLLGEIHHVKDQCPRQTISHETADEAAATAGVTLATPTAAFQAGYKRGMDTSLKNVNDLGQDKFCQMTWKQFGKRGEVWAGLLVRPEAVK